jgi:hypothetical protein
MNLDILSGEAVMGLFNTGFSSPTDLIAETDPKVLRPFIESAADRVWIMFDQGGVDRQLDAAQAQDFYVTETAVLVGDLEAQVAALEAEGFQDQAAAIEAAGGIPTAELLERLMSADMNVDEAKNRDPLEDPDVVEARLRHLDLLGADTNTRAEYYGHIVDTDRKVNELSRRSRLLSTIGAGVLLGGMVLGGMLSFAHAQESDAAHHRGNVASEQVVANDLETGSAFASIMATLGGAAVGNAVGKRRRFVIAHKRAQ